MTSSGSGSRPSALAMVPSWAPSRPGCCRTAQMIAEHFVGHRRIVAALYPGLPDHPGHAVAARQMHGGFGGMLSIRVAGGESAAIVVAARVAVWKRATSLGGVE